ncbi:hypothetical protein AM493_06015 [Flavobacterium akiainvivens]|uniref:Gylcosyl hydrolase 115 C-terminal domain-containing protein n=1 Tax=Flavobacterium akiainvivens TaxID=1202724 RepID=A0A0M8MH27_9FLAO|nr:glycosyl hydrolase 115 family protein [Flavobacterium akiainvivens]KOS05637.1 hypothetical protein AM493_06015 [Flavobacterium akiainvivens]SFQ35831.1 Glycosyl hydrolase family 115 [Flavobacterium akiainvivens]
MIKNIFIAFTLCLGLIGSLSAQHKPLTWFNGKDAVTYSLQVTDAPVIKTATAMFTEDLKQVTGFTPLQQNPNKATVCIVQYDAKLAQKLRKEGVPVDSLATKQDAFYIKALHNQLLIVGSDARGTAYGILELSRLAGVSPWLWWGDATPLKQKKLTVAGNYATFQAPSVEYRGIFINDEDWSTRPWSSKTFDKGEEGLISAKTYTEIFKLLLRLRANTIWPAMHEKTIPFYFVPGAKEAAEACGIVVGTSHCEPLMRNSASEWDDDKLGHYNFINNHDVVMNYWADRLKQVKSSATVFTMGMRGKHDSYMEGVTTLQERTDALQKVIYEQRDLLAKYIDKDVNSIPQQFVPYKEVLDIYENGVNVPEDIMLTWCDDNYGYITRLSNAEEQKRSGGAGVYYHLSYWGRPHDYLWLTTTPPGLIYNEMNEAYKHNAKRQWIVNVHDPKIAAYDMEFFLDLAWNIEFIGPQDINKHLENWLVREFGAKAGKKLLPAMQGLYNQSAIRRPEFMGWSKVEEDKKSYPRGFTPVVDSDLSLTEFGGELDRYLANYQAIKNIVIDAEKDIDPLRKDAFFAIIKYPVFGASAMAVKWLENQRANTIAANLPQDKWVTSKELIDACAKSRNAYNEIISLTDYYNNTMSGGKWQHAMSPNPRGLYVFDAPKLPQLPQGIIEKATPTPYTAGQKAVVNPKEVIAQNAADFTKSAGTVQPIQLLGHSANAVSVAKGASVTFEFEIQAEGEALLRTAVIPTHPNNKGDIRFSVQIDNETPQVCSFKEGFRTDPWKENVLRGQAIRQTKHNLTKGKHTLTITAFDDHVVIDQWMLDFEHERMFYMFPVERK